MPKLKPTFVLTNRNRELINAKTGESRFFEVYVIERDGEPYIEYAEGAASELEAQLMVDYLNGKESNAHSCFSNQSKMQRPVAISQNWKLTSYDREKRKWNQHPVVGAKKTHMDKMKPVSREVWFEYIKLGYLDVNEDVRKWLDENGHSDIKRLS